MIDEETLLNKANKILEENKKKQLLYDNCIKAKICPVCGEKLINENLEIFLKPKTYLFGLIKIKSYNWNNRIICSKDKSHYEYSKDYDDLYF